MFRIKFAPPLIVYMTVLKTFFFTNVLKIKNI